ncbi:hypothetical protein HMPREF1062_01396 [Bacteroides cellulosilyticus CL02T12C19]|jgi:acyl carrier protein|uniref:Carrier domain-containing protein n=1 Tax=Bacteroides cellulosilyticus CL02T12C19 TaxID=997874 RepID=I9QZH8_9BACE|nr:acyl carrier protein [Bacteroides cellulosilyticus]EIY35028.1 hypothetical protein HMPREF1062_01396 [Bacteroides cellulosilyticus CL02T12C19]
MTDNLNKYNEVFYRVFGVKGNELEQLKLKESEGWDSVGHINLIASLEDAFGINMEPDDMFDIFSYKTGIQVLQNQYNIKF